MVVNSSELLNQFWEADFFDIETHKKRLIAQFFPEIKEDSPLWKKIESALIEARTDTERLRLEMIISNWQRQYKAWCVALEDRMKTNIWNILSWNA